MRWGKKDDMIREKTWKSGDDGEEKMDYGSSSLLFEICKIIIPMCGHVFFLKF